MNGFFYKKKANVKICEKTGEPVYLTNNSKGESVVMDIESFDCREKMLKLREELLATEEDQIAGNMGCSPDELDEFLERIIADV